MLTELEQRRAFLCRLTPDRALESLEATLSFLRDRGFLTRSADSALPSFFGACHERPYSPGNKGFGSWPATKYQWFSELARLPGVHELRIHNGKAILLTDETLALADPICRDELDRMEREDGSSARVLRHLAEAGPSSPDDLRTELVLAPRELKSLLLPLERRGAIVRRDVVVREGGHSHSSAIARYDQAYPAPLGGAGGLAELVVAATRAAVIAPERELPRWFSWRCYWDDDLVERLVAGQRLVRVDGHVAVAA